MADASYASSCEGRGLRWSGLRRRVDDGPDCEAFAFAFGPNQSSNQRSNEPANQSGMPSEVPPKTSRPPFAALLPEIRWPVRKSVVERSTESAVEKASLIIGWPARKTIMTVSDSISAETTTIRNVERNRQKSRKQGQQSQILGEVRQSRPT